jgi:deoxyribodipyrimidine photo-lyase
LQDPFSVRKKDNTPFQVFTPYWRNAEEQYLKNKNFINKKITYKKSVIKEDNNAVLNLILPKKKWFEKFEKFWTPGEEMAKTLLKSFIKKKIGEYGTNRDIPSVEGTSKLSPYLAFGEISSQTIFEECYKISQKKIGFRKYINEIGWREFAHHLINFFPQMQTGNLRRQFDKFNWVKDDAKLKKWKQGKTGYPIVDAGMRELHETGWMHNRVRMITASFLVKHLRINWKEGEKHFRDCLLDFNAPNNIAGWQWVAGCGADAAPYFRVFNPILQGEKFDSEGMYVKKWVKELNLIPKKYIHKPWEMPEDEQSLINFNLKKNYYAPIVNHAEARNSALEAFKNLKN